MTELPVRDRSPTTVSNPGYGYVDHGRSEFDGQYSVICNPLEASVSDSTKSCSEGAEGVEGGEGLYELIPGNMM